MNILKKRFKEKKGIAFIITLGLLAVLMITGVTFAVYMKIEREAAGNFALVASARQLALAGVAYAIDDIDFSMDDENDDNNDGLDYYLYPVSNTSWNADSLFYGWYVNKNDFSSDFFSDDDAEDDYDYLINKIYDSNPVAQKLIPPDMFDSAMKLYAVNRMDYYDVFDDDQFDGEDSIFRGNSSYVVINLSGTLDPNYAGGVERSLGGKPIEFQLTELPGVSDSSINDPDDWYENMLELTNGVSIDNVVCLYPFSLFIDNEDYDKFEVYTNANDYEIQHIGDLGEELYDINVSGSVDSSYDRGSSFAAALNLLDYLDDDNIPGNGNPRMRDPGYATPCVEAFPMINEIYIQSSYNSQVAADQYKYRMTTKLNIELWYPFVSPECADDYALQYTIRFGPTALETVFDGVKGLDLIPDDVSGGAATHDPTSRDWTETINLSPADFDVNNNNGLWKMGNRTFNLEPDNNWRYTDLTNITMNLPAGEMIISVDAKIIDKNDSSIVYDAFDFDTVTSDDPFMMQFVYFDETPISGGMQRINEEFDMQVIDPRLNYSMELDGGNFVCWKDMSESGDENIYKINEVTEKYIETNEYADADWKMFVKGYKDNPDPAFLESVGEFGYIFTGRPWETIRLVDKSDTAPRHQIYENLYLEGSGGSTNYGYANINTDYEDVLKAALKDMPLGPEDDAELLIDEKLTSLVSAIQDLTKDGGIHQTNLFYNTTEIYNSIWPTVDEDDLTEFQKEAFYVAGYPSLRCEQQLFAILSMGNYYSSRQICMAIVWRNPIPDENGNHKCFIRELIWLNGE